MISQQQWVSRLQKLAKSRNRSNWELGDVLSQGETEYGKKPCYDLAQKATGYYRGSLYRIAGVAAYFPASLRFENLSWLTYVALRAFPLPFLEKFLPTVADSELSAKIIREKAVAEYGSDPEPHRRPKKYSQVRIAHSLCVKLVERSGTSKVSGLVTQILEEWLVGEKCERYATNANKTREWNQKVKDAGAETVGAQKDDVGAGPRDVPAPADAQPRPEASAEEKRPSYAERRAANEAEAQKRRETTAANKAQREAKRLAAEQKRLAKRAEESPKKRLFKTKLQWTPCHGKSYIANKDGELLPAGKALRATRFNSEAEAEAVNEEFARYYGYREDVVYCASCQAWHLKHRYASEVAEVNLEKSD